MPIIEEYKFCLNIIKNKKEVFNAFDVISLLDVYFDKITFYSIVGKELDKYSEVLGITNITQNNMIIFDICNEYSFSWKFID